MSIERKVIITQLPCKALPESIVICTYAYTNDGGYPRAGYIAAFYTKDGHEHVLKRDLRYHSKAELYNPEIDGKFLMRLAGEEAVSAVNAELMATSSIDYFLQFPDESEQSVDEVILFRRHAHRGKFAGLRRHIAHSGHVTQDLKDMTNTVSAREELPEWLEPSSTKH